jgi:hypothetical protein
MTTEGGCTMYLAPTGERQRKTGSGRVGGIKGHPALRACSKSFLLLFFKKEVFFFLE